MHAAAAAIILHVSGRNVCQSGHGAQLSVCIRSRLQTVVLGRHGHVLRVSVSDARASSISVDGLPCACAQAVATGTLPGLAPPRGTNFACICRRVKAEDARGAEGGLHAACAPACNEIAYTLLRPLTFSLGSIDAGHRHSNSCWPPRALRPRSPVPDVGTSSYRECDVERATWRLAATREARAAPLAKGSARLITEAPRDPFEDDVMPSHMRTTEA